MNGMMCVVVARMSTEGLDEDSVIQQTQLFWSKMQGPGFTEHGRLNLLAGWLQCCEALGLLTHDTAQWCFESLDAGKEIYGDGCSYG